MGKRRPSGDGMVRKRGDGRWEGRIVVGHKANGDLIFRHIHTMLHGAMKAAVQAHTIPKNPAENATAPKLNYKPMQVLNEQELDTFLQAVQKDDAWRDFFYTELMTGLRRGEICALMWRDFDAKTGTLKICRTLHSKGQGIYALGDTKTSQGNRTIILPESVAALLRARKKVSISQWIFPQPTSPELPMNPGTAYRRLKTLLEEAGLPSIRFHDLRHPYVKHTTKIFSLRLMDFQAQAYPDARRKTRGACQLHRGGQSRNPVRPLCNRKRFSCLPPQSKMSWILYAISMRLSGYTSTRSISSSASSVVSVSASKIALDASLRLSCRACSSCFCFACANTAA